MSFIEVFDAEVKAATEDSWYELLCWVRSTGYGGVDPEKKAAYREEAKRRTAEGQFPPWPDHEDD